MLPSSLAVVMTGVFLGCVGLCVFVWAWRAGQFEGIAQQARLILDERDCRLVRPWENAAQQEERRREYGALIQPEPGEWGGAS